MSAQTAALFASAPARETTYPPLRLARIAGVLYLGVGILGGWAHLAVRGSIYVPDDAAATTANVIEHATLVRLGFMADLVACMLFLFLSFTLYALLRHVQRDVARAMVVFVATASAITSLNLLNQWGALMVATEPAYANAFGGRDAMVLLLMELQHYGYLIAQVTFGLWLLPLGYLVYRSGMFPRWLGVLLGVGCFSYLIHLTLRFLAPDVASSVETFVTAPAAIAEVTMVGYLLIKGVRRV